VRAGITPLGVGTPRSQGTGLSSWKGQILQWVLSITGQPLTQLIGANFEEFLAAAVGIEAQGGAMASEGDEGMISVMLERLRVEAGREQAQTAKIR